MSSLRDLSQVRVVSDLGISSYVGMEVLATHDAGLVGSDDVWRVVSAQPRLQEQREDLPCSSDGDVVTRNCWRKWQSFPEAVSLPDTAEGHVVWR